MEQRIPIALAISKAYWSVYLMQEEFSPDYVVCRYSGPTEELQDAEELVGNMSFGSHLQRGHASHRRALS